MRFRSERNRRIRRMDDGEMAMLNNFVKEPRVESMMEWEGDEGEACGVDLVNSSELR